MKRLIPILLLAFLRFATAQSADEYFLTEDVPPNPYQYQDGLVQWLNGNDGTNATAGIGSDALVVSRTCLTTDGVGDYLTVPGLSVTDKVTLVGWEFGPELVVNGGFDTDSDWVKDGSTTISGGTANINATNEFGIRQLNMLTVGNVYQISDTILPNTSVGTVGLQFETILYRKTAGTYTYYGEAVVPDFRYYCSGTVNLSIDNISVREITLNQSTAIPTVSAGQIDFTAGTVAGILINDELVYTCEEGHGDTLYSVSENWGDTTITTTSGLTTMWGGTCDGPSFQARDGFSAYSVFDGVDDAVDTGIVVTNSSVITMIGRFTDITPFSYDLMGARNADDSERCEFGANNGSPNKWVARWGSTYVISTENADEDWHVFTFSNAGLYVDGELVCDTSGDSITSELRTFRVAGLLNAGLLSAYNIPLDVAKFTIDGKDLRPSLRYPGVMEDALNPPALGGELIANGGFSSWTDDDPDGWVINGELGSDPMVTEVDGECRIYSSSAYIAIQQSILTAGTTYLVTVEVTDLTDGLLSINLGGSPYYLNSVGIHAFIATAEGSLIIIKRGGGAGDDGRVKIVSCRELNVYPNPLNTGEYTPLPLTRIPAIPGTSLDATGNTLTTAGGAVHNGGDYSIAWAGTTNTASELAALPGFSGFPIRNAYYYTNAPSALFTNTVINIAPWSGVYLEAE